MSCIRTLEHYMAVLTLYLDSSILGGYFDAEFDEPTRMLFRMAEVGRCRFITSVVAQQEISLAPPNVVRLFGRTFAVEPMLELTARAEELATAYLQAGVVSGRYVDDARHVAIATTHGVGVLISWNFRHLVSYRRESGFNRVNLDSGYPAVRIISPLEIVYEDEQDEAV